MIIFQSGSFMATGQKGGFSESKLTKASTLFFIIDGEPISIELNKCDLDGLDSEKVSGRFLPKYQNTPQGVYRKVKGFT